MPHDDVDISMELATYRIRQAQEDIRSAESMLPLNFCLAADNRLYYAVFHAILAIHALDRRETKTHKRAIGEFNRNYTKTGIFDKSFVKKLSRLELARNGSDYDDFYVPDAERTRENLTFAKEFVDAVKRYCEDRMRLSAENKDQI